MFTTGAADKLLKLYRKGSHDLLHGHILRTFADFNKKVYVRSFSSVSDEIGRFLETFFFLMSQRDFSIRSVWEHYLGYVTLLENLTYLSAYGTTTETLACLTRGGQADVYKQLLLSNAKIELDLQCIDRFFTTNPKPASFWLYSLFTRHNFCHASVAKNLRSLQRQLLDYNLYLFDRICALYFNATYVDPESHLRVRHKVVETIRKQMVLPGIRNVCTKKGLPRIAIVSKNWHRNHAVRKCIGAFIRPLKEIADLVLIRINTECGAAAPACFSESRTVRSYQGHLECSSIAENDFNMVIFTDVGLNIESLLLASMRLAPLQVAMYGHPVSTASPFIDYFIVGALSETAEVSSHYTEKTVAIQGTGMNATRPRVSRPSFEDKTCCLNPGTLNIFVSASGPKINEVIVRQWVKIIKHSSRPVLLHLLPGEAGMQEMSVLRHVLQGCLGRHTIKVHRRHSYEQYMEVVKRCDLAIGSYHYGDYNRVIDALWMGTPFIVIQGNCGYQNTGVAALRAVGLEELIAEDLDAYVEKTVKLVAEDDRRQELQQKIISLPVEPLLVENGRYSAGFVDTIYRLLQEQPDLARCANLSGHEL
jgi:predicted O-linked N-acetylglucosamine transferase (SPINDLY family)